jgi:hypothetical protein
MLIGVPGRKLLPGQEDAVTQDFLATSHSVTSAVRNARQFMAFIRALRNPFALPAEVGLSESLRILKALIITVLLSKVRSLVTERFSSTAPVKNGAVRGEVHRTGCRRVRASNETSLNE